MRESLVVLFLLVSSNAANAQYVAPPEPTGVCVSCSSGPSSSGTDPQTAAAIAAEKAERARVDRENAARMSAERRVHTIRSANADGVAAYNKKQWAAAIRLFEKVLAMNPEDSYARANLDAAVRAQADESARRQRELDEKRRADELAKYRQAHAAEQKRLAKKLATGAAVPPPGTSPAVAVGSRLDDKQAPAIRESRELIQSTLDAVGDRAKEEAIGRLDGMIDIMTPQGLFLRIQMNTTKLATEGIPTMLTAAANGEILPDDPLTLKAVTMVFNVGSLPGEMAEKLVKVGSAGKVILDEAEQRTTKFLQDGITSLTIRLGARASGGGARFEADANALLEEVERVRPVVERWTAKPEGAQ